MKKFLAVLLACAMVFAFATTALAADTQIADFNDIADQSQVMKDAIQRLAVLGVFQGDEGLGGAFRHGDTLTRAEFAKIVCLLAGVTTSAEAEAMRDTPSTIFKDVTTGWYTGWVQIAGENGFVKGRTNGNFDANANITYQEVATVLLRVVGYDDHLGGNGNGRVGTWPENYNTKARTVGLTDNVTYVARNPITRGAMALMADNSLELDMVSYISDAAAANNAIVSGDGDRDWFVEVSYETNSGKEANMNVLKKAFDAVAVTVLFDAAEGREFDETAAWSYEDFKDGEFQVTFQRVRESSNPERWVDYDVTKSVASNYYITKGYNFPDLANMIAKVTYYDKSNNEVCFIQVNSSTQTGDVYQDGSRTNVGGTSITKSNHPIYAVNEIKDYSVTGETAYLTYEDSDKDNTFPGKVYLDAEGRVYAVKNYDAFETNNDTAHTARSYGIFDEVSGNNIEYKNDPSKKLLDIDTSKEDHIFYRDGKFVKSDGLEENDVIYDLGANGTDFFLVHTPETGDLTKYNETKVTIAGTAYKVVGEELFVSTDGGEKFKQEKLKELELDTSAFGDATYVPHYSFGRLVYVASAAEAKDKVIGVVTDITYRSVISGGHTFSGITIYNAEGKEVTYNFESDFKDAYNTYAAETTDGGGDPDDIKDYIEFETNADITKYFGEAYVDSDFAGYHGFDIGMIVELGIDKSGNLASVENARPFNPMAATKEVTINSAKTRVSVPADLPTGETGGNYYIDSDAIVFDVSLKSATDRRYNKTSIQTASQLLSNDFKTYCFWPFNSSDDSGNNLDVVYLISDKSAESIGVISSSYRASGGWALTIDGKEDIVAKSRNDVPALVRYYTKEGEVVVDNRLVTPANFFTFDNTAALGTLATDMDLDTTDTDYIYVGFGDVLTTEGSGKDRTTLKLDAPYGNDSSASTPSVKDNFLIEADTYIYDFEEEEEITVTRDLRGKTVMVVMDGTDVLYVLVGGTIPTADELRTQRAEALAAILGSTATASTTTPGLVTLSADTTLTAALPFGADVKLNLNGHTLTVQNTITLNTVTDITNGTVNMSHANAEIAGAIPQVGGSNVTTPNTYTVNASGVWSL